MLLELLCLIHGHFAVLPRERVLILHLVDAALELCQLLCQVSDIGLAGLELLGDLFSHDLKPTDLALLYLKLQALLLQLECVLGQELFLVRECSGELLLDLGQSVLLPVELLDLPVQVFVVILDGPELLGVLLDLFFLQDELLLLVFVQLLDLALEVRDLLLQVSYFLLLALSDLGDLGL